MIKLHNADLNNLCSLFNIVRILNKEETQGRVWGYGEMRIHEDFEQRAPKENNVHLWSVIMHLSSYCLPQHACECP
jgi:hypothetical protein